MESRTAEEEKRQVQNVQFFRIFCGAGCSFLSSSLILRITCQPGSVFECRLKDFERIYDYDGNATCAADGMCQEKCPVKINTGELIKAIRAEEMSKETTASNLAMVGPCPFTNL